MNVGTGVSKLKTVAKDINFFTNSHFLNSLPFTEKSCTKEREIGKKNENREVEEIEKTLRI